jgi:hypothetical protein
LCTIFLIFFLKNTFACCCCCCFFLKRTNNDATTTPLVNASNDALAPFIADWIAEANAVDFLARRGFAVIGVRLERLDSDALRTLAKKLELDVDERWLGAAVAVVRRAFASRFDVAWPRESVASLERAFHALPRYACYGAWRDVDVSRCEALN